MAVGHYSTPGFPNGVATGAIAAPVSVAAVTSPGTEPLHVHKSFLATEFKIENSNKTLLVINAHSLNFVKTKAYVGQLQQIAAIVAAHDGPVLFAGDFNSWNQQRRQLLEQLATQYGLTKVLFPGNSALQLDGAFVRQLTVEDYGIDTAVSSSDHKPRYLVASPQL